MVIALVLWLLLPVAWAALPWLPPNRTFGCFVAAAHLMLSVAALSVGMPHGESATVVPHSRAGLLCGATGVRALDAPEERISNAVRR